MGKGLKLQKAKNLRRQFPWTWKGIIIEFYLRDQMQKTLQVELGLSKNNREPWHWEITATLEILEQRRGARYTHGLDEGSALQQEATRKKICELRHKILNLGTTEV